MPATISKASSTSVDDINLLVHADHWDPFRILGPHEVAIGGSKIRVVRAFLPEARAAWVVDLAQGEPGTKVPMERVHPDGYFECIFPERSAPFPYRLAIENQEGHRWDFVDPYQFGPVLSDFDLHLLGEGTHYRNYERLGAHLREIEGIRGVHFAVWAPNAQRVSVVGNFNHWDGRRHPLRNCGPSGVWEIFLPDLSEGEAERENCVIVATSVLELGIDVGDLDRVIQLDSPPSVASLLQRMGRTGRREGTTRNCLFLATSEETLVRSAGLIDLWLEGYVEPIVPPPEPYHILAQQVMALALQEQGIGASAVKDWLGRVPAFVRMMPEPFRKILQWMVREEILWSEQGILGLGRKGEEEFGRRNFLALFSVFVSPPLFTVLQGRKELGFVDEATFLQKKEGPRILMLGGRAWLINHVDWQRRTAFVEPTEARGRSRWKGEGRGSSYALSQAIRRVLVSNDVKELWSRRARDRIEGLRLEYAWLKPSSSVLLIDREAGLEWWTFAGARVNAMLAGELSRMTASRVDHDDLLLTFGSQVSAVDIEGAIAVLRGKPPETIRPSIDERAVDGLKFSECLPRDLASEMLERRLGDTVSLRSFFAEEVSVIPAGAP